MDYATHHSLKPLDLCIRVILKKKNCKMYSNRRPGSIHERLIKHTLIRICRPVSQPKVCLRAYQVSKKKNGTRTFRYNKRNIQIDDLKLCTRLKQYFCSSVSKFEVNMSVFAKVTAFYKSCQY